MQAKQVLVGYISLVQEQRFRLITDDGRGFLFTLERNASVEIADLHKLQKSHERVRVQYTGEPNTISGLVQEIQPLQGK